VEYTILGRTGLKVSVAGLGCGGPSRLGLRGNSRSEEHAIRLIKQALDLGINLLDTAEAYGTEAVVGKAIAGTPRDRLVISSKKTLPRPDGRNLEGEFKKSLEQSLKLMRTDYIDIYHLHGVEPKDYVFAKERLMPIMLSLRESGQIRFIGATEGFVVDPSHQMMQEGLRENFWDVIMIGFNILNPSARKTILPLTIKDDVGVLAMFAVRRALSQNDRLRAICEEQIKKGAISARAVNLEEPLGFVLADGGAATLPEAAYRFCRHEPGVHVVLTGTGNPDHLRANVEGMLKPRLQESVLRRLEDLFGNLDHLTGN
jgi:aryl-alcohol dehydrogenase-like predicted oxidoreductase